MTASSSAATRALLAEEQARRIQASRDYHTRMAQQASTAPEPWPAPEVRATPVRDHRTLPQGARKLVSLATPGAWEATYARGPKKAKVGWRTVDSVVVRVRKGQRVVAAAYIDGQLDVAYAAHVGKVSFEQAKWYLTEEHDIPWLEGLGPLTLSD